mmetsp:Transcript_41956/g.111367  ORF Transcript_41956/g.111367 Transcript_41956/m.111367 type:complete len:304 (-) Transcript_41956:61-972(-)
MNSGCARQAEQTDLLGTRRLDSLRLEVVLVQRIHIDCRVRHHCQPELLTLVDKGDVHVPLSHDQREEPHSTLCESGTHRSGQRGNLLMKVQHVRADDDVEASAGLQPWRLTLLPEGAPRLVGPVSRWPPARASGLVRLPKVPPDLHGVSRGSPRARALEGNLHRAAGAVDVQQHVLEALPAAVGEHHVASPEQRRENAAEADPTAQLQHAPLLDQLTLCQEGPREDQRAAPHLRGNCGVRVCRQADRVAAKDIARGQRERDSITWTRMRTEVPLRLWKERRTIPLGAVVRGVRRCRCHVKALR